MVTFLKSRRGQREQREVLKLSERSVSVRVDSANDNAMTIEAVLSTEQPVRMYDWWEGTRMDEILLSSGREKVDTIPMLDSHRRWSLDDVYGHMNNVRTEGTDTVVTCQFDKDDENAVKAYRKYKNGHCRALSVGYTVLKFVDIAPGQSAVIDGRTFTAGPERKTRVVTKWRPDEGSLVVIGADSKAKTRIVSRTRGLSTEMSDDEIEEMKARRERREAAKKAKTARNEAAEPQLRIIEAVSQPLEARLESTSQPTVVVNVNNGDAGRSQGSNSAPAGANKEGSSVDPVNQSVPAESGGDNERSGAMGAQVAAGETAVDSEEVRNKAIEEGVKREFDRQEQIRSIAGDDVSPECLQKCLSDRTCSVDKARSLFLDDIRASRAVASRPSESDSPAPSTSGGRSSRAAASIEVLTAAVTLRLGGEAAVKNLQYMQYDHITGKLRMRRRSVQITDEQRKQHERIVNDAYEFERRESFEICDHALRIAGVERPLEKEDVVTRAFSTPAVSTIYTQTMGAILLTNLGEMEDSTQGWCKEQDVKNFKQNELHRLEGGRLKKRNRGEKARQASFADTMEAYKLAEYANTLIIDRQDLIDDDLNAWLTAMDEYARGVQDLRPSLVYGFLAANAALATDSKALFHADHKNVLTGSALAAATLQNALNLLSSARGAGGLNLNLRNAVLVTSENLSFTADQLTGSAEIREAAAANGTMNPLRKRNIATRSDSRLNNGFVNPANEIDVAGAPNTWYVAAAGGAYGIHVGYRTGTNRMPTMTSEVMKGGGKYGLAIDVQHDIGVGVQGYQGVVRATN
jgi:hypothetical protein